MNTCESSKRSTQFTKQLSSVDERDFPGLGMQRLKHSWLTFAKLFMMTAC
jgi:hypothetical protein